MFLLRQQTPAKHDIEARNPHPYENWPKLLLNTTLTVSLSYNALEYGWLTGLVGCLVDC